MRKIALITFALALLSGCAGRGGKAPETSFEPRHFPKVEVPAVLSDPVELRQYVAEHFWDAFFAGNGPTDTACILGVRKAEVEAAMSTFISRLDQSPMEEAQRSVARLFSQIEARQSLDTGSHVFLLMTEYVAKYLYDPNSPLRNEDYYIPFLEGMVASPYVDEASRPGYEYQLRACSLTPAGTKAPDIDFTDSRGRQRSLHKVQARYTLLFFSNPGCHACGKIVDALNRPLVEGLVDRGTLAVVSMYPDEEIEKWRHHLGDYPSDWIVGYDTNHSVIGDGLYDLRAIPSLYLLDSEKNIILRDAPVEKVLLYLSNNLNQ